MARTGQAVASCGGADAPAVWSAALFALAALLLAPPFASDAAAQDVPVWRGEVEVGTSSQTSGGTTIALTGFGAAGSVGSLDDTTVRVSGQTHTVEQIAVEVATAVGGTILSNEFAVAFAAGLPDDVRGSLKLHVTGHAEPFAFSEATYDSSSHAYSWTGHGLTWSEDERISLHITRGRVEDDVALSELRLEDMSRGAAVALEPAFLGQRTGYSVVAGSIDAELRITFRTADPRASVRFFAVSEATDLSGSSVRAIKDGVVDLGGGRGRIDTSIDAGYWRFDVTVYSQKGKFARDYELRVLVRGDPPELEQAYLAPAFSNETTAKAVYLKYDRNMDTPVAPPPSAFSVTVDGDPVAVTGTNFIGNVLKLTMERAVGHRVREVTVNYTRPARNPVQTIAGGLAAELTAHPVENRIPSSGPGNGGASGMELFFATMTVGRDGGNARAGYNDGTIDAGDVDPIGALTGTGFFFGRAEYTVHSLSVGDDGALGLTLSGSLTQAAAAPLDLYVGNRKFRLARADTFEAAANRRTWQSTGLALAAGEKVEVLIVDARRALTGALRNVPARHGSPFTFEVRFSEEVAVSAETLRDHAFTVTGGEVTGVRQLNPPGARSWEIAVEASSEEAVTVVLPAPTDCAAPGAICTADGRPLSAKLSATVEGPLPALTVSFESVPGTHDGTNEFVVSFAFSEAPHGLSYTTLRDSAFEVTNGEVTEVRRLNRGRLNPRKDERWEITVLPAGSDDVTVTLPETTGDCGESGAICTEDERKLSGTISATVERAAPPESPPESPPDLTASFESVPDTHDGTNDIVFRIAFSEDPHELSFRTVRHEAFTVTNGAVKRVRRLEQGKERRWEITVAPAGSGDVTVTLPATTSDCGESGAICTGDGRKLSGVLSATVEGRVPDLTVSFESVPGTHDGTSDIVFRIAFSVEPHNLSFKTLRDSAFEVTNGAVTRAERLEQGKDRRWRITVAPSGSGDVTVTLPATTGDCATSGAICTGYERKLANRLHKVIKGPPAEFSVADARVDEDEGAVLAFAVTLSRAMSGPVSVDYATSDGTATQGVDYRAARATLTFEAGELSNTIEVEVLNDVEDEGEETLTLALSNPSGGNVSLADAEATGTIVNSDPMPRAWLARFGRTASVHTVDAIRERLAGGPRSAQDNHFTVGGQRVDQLFDDFRNAARGADTKETADRAAPDRRLEDESAWDRMDRLKAESMGWWAAPGRAAPGGFGLAEGGFAGGAPGGRASAGLPSSGASLSGEASAGLPAAEPLLGRGPSSASLPSAGLLSTARPFADLLSRGREDWRALLMGSSFDYSRTLADGTETRNGLSSWSAWGRAAETRFSGADGELSIDGAVATATVGADAQWGRWLAGVAVSHSFGEGGYSHATAAGGDVTSRLTSINPYANFTLNERLSLWGAVGYGVGDLSLQSKRAGDAIETGLESTMAAFGGRGVFSRRAGGLNLAVVSDALFTNTVSEAAAGLMGAEGASSRVRLMLEGSGSMPLANGAVLRPTLEAGLRYDGGDAETGAGVEIGGGLAWSAGRLSVELNVRGLLAHEDAEYEEWGFSGSLKWQPNEDGRGWAMEAGSSWGDTASGVNALWSRQDASGLARAAGMDAARRFQAQLGYGFEGRRGRALWVPFVGAESSAGQQAYRMGLKLTSGPNLEAGLELGRRAGARGVAEDAFRLQGTVRW